MDICKKTLKEMKVFLIKRYQQCKSTNAERCAKSYQCMLWKIDALEKTKETEGIAIASELYSKIRGPMESDINEFIVDQISDLSVIPPFIIRSGEIDKAAKNGDENDKKNDKKKGKKTSKKRGRGKHKEEDNPPSKKRKLNEMKSVSSTPQRSGVDVLLESFKKNGRAFTSWDNGGIVMIYIHFLRQNESIQWCTKREIKYLAHEMKELVQIEENSLCVFPAKYKPIIANSKLENGWYIKDKFKDQITEVAFAIDSMVTAKIESVIDTMVTSGNFNGNPYKRGGRKKTKQDAFESDESSHSTDLEQLFDEMHMPGSQVLELESEEEAKEESNAVRMILGEVAAFFEEIARKIWKLLNLTDIILIIDI
eukprot:494154_1